MAPARNARSLAKDCFHKVTDFQSVTGYVLGIAVTSVLSTGSPLYGYRQASSGKMKDDIVFAAQ